MNFVQGLLVAILIFAILMIIVIFAVVKIIEMLIKSAKEMKDEDTDR